MTCGVYEFWCGPHFYQGSSKNIEGRWATHRLELSKGTHGNPKVQSAYNKYGWTDAGILVECEEHTLLAWEQAYIDTNWGDEKFLNINPKADRPRSPKGLVRSPEYKAKMSVSKAKWHSANPAHGAATSARNKSRVWSEESREKVRAAATGHCPTPEARAKMSEAQKQRPHRAPPSAEARAKMSASAKARCERRKAEKMNDAPADILDLFGAGEP